MGDFTTLCYPQLGIYFITPTVFAVAELVTKDG